MFVEHFLAVFAVDPLSGAPLDVSSKCLGKQIFLPFAVDPLSVLLLDFSWECIGKQLLSLFAVDPSLRPLLTCLGNVMVS